MTEARRRDLSYGHLGETTYSPETGEWQFSRNLGIKTITDALKGRTLKPFGDLFTALPSTLLSAPLHCVQSAATRNKQITELVRGNPTLAPAAAILPSLAQVSEIINEATSSHDPIVGDLITFGKATRSEKQGFGEGTIDVAAIAGGPAGEAVRLIQVEKMRLEFEGNGGVQLEAQTLEERGHGLWLDDGSPILQLCFSSNTGNIREPGAWLAVRKAEAVTILRPLIRRSAIMAQNPHAMERLIRGYAPSRLDANPFLILPKERTGGIPLSDVSFNPWYDRQFAVIDQKGHWSIWDMERQGKLRNTWGLTAGPSGNLLEVKDSRLHNIIDDGWGAILWAGNSNTIVVANRNNLVVYLIKKRAHRLDTPNLAVPARSDWILDIKRYSRDPSYLFVLTSTIVLWLCVSSDSEEIPENMQFDSIIKLSWRHYLNPEDLSLRLLVDSGTEDTIMILVYSRLKELTIGFNCAASPTNMPHSVSDPFIVPTSNSKAESDPVSTGKWEPQYGICTSSLILRPVNTLHLSSGGYIPEESKFYQMFTLRNDLAVTERLYIRVSPNATPPGGRFITKRTVTALKKTSTIVTEDDFIVADGMESEEEVPYLSVRAFTKARYKNTSRTHEEEGDSSNVNFEWLARKIEIYKSSRDQSHLTLDQPTAYKIPDDYVEDLKQVGSSNSEITYSGIKSLLECSPYQLAVDDIDAASETLATFLEEVVRDNLVEDDDRGTSAEGNRRWNPISYLGLLRASSPLLSHEGDGSNISLVQLYDRLVKHWITSLAPDIPGRVRVAIEKRLRRTATEIYLSSYGIMTSLPSTLSAEPSELGSNEISQLTPPVWSKPFRSNLSTKGKGKSR
ncbi:MAG: hypothetical protein Q9187_002302, partial [Circinaria calcarea]